MIFNTETLPEVCEEITDIFNQRKFAVSEQILVLQALKEEITMKAVTDFIVDAVAAENRKRYTESRIQTKCYIDRKFDREVKAIIKHIAKGGKK